MSKDLEDRLAKIEARNKRVELDKKWETSWTRKISIIILTYIVIGAYLYLVVHIDPWVNAIVPTIGFLLSTLTIAHVKAYWVKKQEE